MRSVKNLSPAAVLAVVLTAACSESSLLQGAAGAADAGDPCDQLVQRTCSSDAAPNACDGEPSCEAARLTRRWERDRCEERNNDTVRYKTCGSFNLPQAGANDQNPTSCDDLRRKVCGSGSGCAEADACVLAQDLVDPRTCDQAMGDETSFPACPVAGNGSGPPGGAQNSSSAAGAGTISTGTGGTGSRAASSSGSTSGSGAGAGG